MTHNNQTVINLWGKVLNEVENDTEFMCDVNQAAEKAANLAAFQMRESLIREEVLHRMQEKVWHHMESEG